MIVLYKGSRGKGKTLSMTKDAFIYFQHGFRVLSNFSLKFGEKVSNEGILALNKDSALFDCVLVIDELQILFDSRSWKKDTSLKFSNFIQQIRKRNIIILATTQYVNTVDKRFRQHIDVFAYPEFSKELAYCKVTYLDLSSFEDIDLKILTNDSISLDVLKRRTIVFFARPIYALYNTAEMIA